MPRDFDGEKFLAGASAVCDAIASSGQLKAALGNPAVPAAAKENILRALAGRAGLSEIGQRFLQVVLRNRRLLHLPEIVSAVRQGLDERAGVLPARVTAATALSEAEKNRLVAELARASGKSIRATFEVDPGLLAGFIARVGSKVYDASIATAIEKFKEEAYGN